MTEVKDYITRFIALVADRLPAVAEQEGSEDIPFFGFELKLTGVKEYNGKPLVDNKLYEINVPILKGIMFKDETTGEIVNEVRYADHKHLLRNAYLTKGLSGIYLYLGKYMTQDEVDKVRNTFMQINGSKEVI